MEAAEVEVLGVDVGRRADPFLSLLCSFGAWYNGTGRAERHSRLLSAAQGGGNGGNASERAMMRARVELFAREWSVFLPPRHMGALQTCPLLGFLAVVVVIPVVLAQIATRSQLRGETRFLLLANALLSDLLFLSVYALTGCLTTAGVVMSPGACAATLFLLGALYCAGLLSLKAMVLDALLAVLTPLRYLALWPVSRTRWALVCIWLVSVLFPAAAVGAFVWYHTTAGSCSLHICSLPLLLVLTVSHSTPLQVSMLLTVAGVLLVLLLVFSGYLALCRGALLLSSSSPSSSSSPHRPPRPAPPSRRARGTFLVHFLHLFLSVLPVLALGAELLLLYHPGRGGRAPEPLAELWAAQVACNVLLVLPKGAAPYLYGLRYRRLRAPTLAFYGLGGRGGAAAVTPVM